MKPPLLICCFLLAVASHAQVKEVSLLPSKDSLISKAAGPLPAKPDVLNSGFIDIINNGQVNASARFVRLYVGEPGRFYFPLAVYSGVSSNNFQQPIGAGGLKSNEQLVMNYINPLSGLVNLSTDDILYGKHKKLNTTRFGLIYHFGLRVLTGFRQGPITDPLTGKPINFLSNFLLSGLYCQTGAWEKSNTKNLGICWLALRYIINVNPKKPLQDMMPGIQTNGIYHGWSAAWGIEISNLVNIKMIYYRYVKKPEIDYSLPIYQFSFNYSLR